MKGGVAVCIWLCTAGLASAAHDGQALEFTDQAGSPAECHAVLAEPRLLERNGGRGIVFGETGHVFPIYKLKTITEIRPWPAPAN